MLTHSSLPLSLSYSSHYSLHSLGTLKLAHSPSSTPTPTASQAPTLGLSWPCRHSRTPALLTAGPCCPAALLNPDEALCPQLRPLHQITSPASHRSKSQQSKTPWDGSPAPLHAVVDSVPRMEATNSSPAIHGSSSSLCHPHPTSLLALSLACNPVSPKTRAKS